MKKKNISILKGQVIKNKMQKSIVVSVKKLMRHPIYGKFIRKTTKLHVHDELNVSKIGDIVEIQSCRPIAKTKSWKLKKINKKNV
ncbi:30S ribosomal subunit protein S17 [Wigglesworthia glossinidia endosymbiont of Glossina morsitans morsitans (Yale colony)]|uniref:Small ribosomal subunit protein uS17 n=1 Tax=Wigglesworthia glossinidia endosymbiont of Glossina morsitans morsitans (Yale colony) TaxID=1142511 RepID=H6Q4I4_WIGGL|nr:30S ribosomal protein S17 [Wigglesworthia glossinidia]AFA41044.1 30S ribosomal subunit protein S17 [Wigglesworthia glossinidia endosymbiont of Glossina morsitans morsitans (Yale colony)]